MEENKKTPAIVLSRQDYRENDSLVAFYTLDYGKLFLIARGTKKTKSKLVGHLEPFNFVDLMIISGKGRDYVGGVVVKEAFLNLKEDLNSLYYAGQGLNWLNKLSGEAEADGEVFALLLGYLNFFNNKLNPVLAYDEGEIMFTYFIFKVLNKLGYKPQLQNCLKCGKKLKPGKNFFNFNSGGIICASCFSSIKDQDKRELLQISDNSIKLLRLILNEDFASQSKLIMDKKIIKEISVITLGYLNYRL